MKLSSLLFKTRTLLFALLLIGSATSASWAATYYVSATGYDSNPGTLTSPFKTVQHAVSVAVAGDTVYLRSGTYYESITLKNCGTSTAPITLQNYSGETATINSGNSMAVQAGSGTNYYTFNGLRFISNHVYYRSGFDWSLDFEGSSWGGTTSPSAGNNGFVLKNCYIEGAVHVYGHYVTIDSCELNGKSVWQDGIYEYFQSSHDNVYKNNNIHNYVNRGVWTMQGTKNALIANNTIHDIRNGNGQDNAGVDADGAGTPVYNTTITGNSIYNCDGRGIEFENGWYGIAEKNTIHDIGLSTLGAFSAGIHFINYGPTIANAEYRNQNTNGIARNNIIYNIGQGGIVLRASPGNKVYNNTIYNITGTYGSFGLLSDSTFYSINEDIRNNIMAESGAYLFYASSGGSYTGMTINNNQYYSSTKSNVIYWGPNNAAYTIAGFQSATGYDTNSRSGSPAFNNTAGFDFSLQATSPAIDAGATLTAVPTDITGTARPVGPAYDIGAYEYNLGLTVLSAPQNLSVM
jgi:parallel beta-helix repeat protein